jgi:hypothetical protein
MTALMDLRYMLLMLIIPAYIIALSRRRWTTIPLWLVSSFVMLTQFFISVQQTNHLGGGTAEHSFVYVGEMTKIMLIPIVVELTLWSSVRIRLANQAKKAPRRLVEAWDWGKR